MFKQPRIEDMFFCLLNHASFLSAKIKIITMPKAKTTAPCTVFTLYPITEDIMPQHIDKMMFLILNFILNH